MICKLNVKQGVSYMSKISKIGKYILAVILTIVLVLMVTQIYSAYRSLSTFGDSILQEEERSLFYRAIIMNFMLKPNIFLKL